MRAAWGRDTDRARGRSGRGAWEDGEGVLAVDAPIGSGFEIEDAGSDVRILAFADFAFTVEIPNGFGQELKDIGALGAEGVVDMVHRNDV